MKKITLFLLLAVLAWGKPLVAQTGKYGATPEDSIECIKYLSFYREYYKGGNIKESIPSWRGALKGCPEGVTQRLYQDGQNILKYMIARVKDDPARRKELIDSLLMMYDIRVKYYPKSRLSAYTFKVYDMVKFCEGDDAGIYKAAKNAVDFGREKTDEMMYVFLMQSAINLKTAGELSTEDVMDIYSEVSDLFDKKMALCSEEQNNSSGERLRDAQHKFETLFAMSGLAECDNILTIFGPKLEQNIGDLNFVKRIVHLLSIAGCEKSDLFLKAVETLYNLEPSASSAYYLYRLYSSRDRDREAMSCLQQAIDDPQTDVKTDAEYLIEMGTYYFKKMNQSAKAVEMARKAMQTDENVVGKGNLLLGHIWALAKPSGTEIDAVANFWVAIDYFNRAKSADPSLEEECNKLIATYRQYYPTVEDAFMHDLSNGSSYTVTWNGISATTTVRTRK